MSPAPARARDGTLRFALPPTLGPAVAVERARRLELWLGQQLSRAVEVTVPASYELLARELLSGKADAAWAPPFVCARIEAMGVRVLLRGVRGGASSYRAALLARAGEPFTLARLNGATAAWADRDSVGGYLLPLAYLRGKQLDPAKVLAGQTFCGSYRAALEAVLNGAADLTSIFAPAPRPPAPVTTGLSELWPEKESAFQVVAFTDESPNDGVAVSMSVPAPTVQALEKALLELPGSDEGRVLLKELFNAEAFEVAPRMGYRALYRVALASL